MTSFAASAEFVLIPRGQTVTVTEESYLCTQEDGRDLLTMIRTERAEKEIWEQAVAAIREELNESQGDLTRRLTALEAALNDERVARAKDRRRSFLFVAGALALGYVVGD